MHIHKNVMMLLCLVNMCVMLELDEKTVENLYVTINKSNGVFDIPMLFSTRTVGAHYEN